MNSINSFHASHTGAARAAVDNLTKSLAIEWAASGVRVNAVAPVSAERVLNCVHCWKCVFPGLCIFTTCRVPFFQRLRWRTTRILGLTYSGCPFHTALPKDWEFQKRCLTVERHKFHKKACSKKEKKPHFAFAVSAQISSAVCFLLSPAASYISGATLKVDAGQSLYHSMWEIPSRWILVII